MDQLQPGMAHLEEAFPIVEHGMPTYLRVIGRDQSGAAYLREKQQPRQHMGHQHFPEAERFRRADEDGIVRQRDHLVHFRQRRNPVEPRMMMRPARS